MFINISGFLVSGADEREITSGNRGTPVRVNSDGVPENSGGVPNGERKSGGMFSIRRILRRNSGVKDRRWKTTRHHVPAGTVADILTFTGII